MALVICVPSSETLISPKVKDQIAEVCKHVIRHGEQSLLIPEPGKLMDLLRILKENAIPYHFQEFVFKT